MNRSSDGPRRDGSGAAAAPADRGGVNPVALVALGVAASSLLLVLLAVTAWGTYRAHSAEQEIQGLGRAIGRFAALNGAMTRSVRMVALRGDPTWRAEYVQLAGEAGSELRRVVELADRVGSEAAAERLANAERRTGEVEREVLGLAGQGERNAALERISSREYVEQEDALISSLASLDEAVASSLREDAASARRSGVVGAVLAAGALLALVATWLQVLALLRGHLRERDRAERELSGSEGELSALIRSMNDTILVFDGEGRYLDVAPTDTSLMIPAEELPGKLLHDLHPPGTADLFLLHIRRALATGETQHLEYSLCLEGRTIWRSAAISPMPGERVVWVARDISALKAAEERSRAERAYLRAVIDASPGLIFAKDSEGRYTLANRGAADVYATTPEELVGKTDADLNSNCPQVEEFLRTDRAVIDTGEDVLLPEGRVTSMRTGESRWYQIRKVRLELPDGAPQVLGIATDITERKQAEDAVRAMSQRLESHREQTLLSVIECDLDGIVRSWNPAAEGTFGYREEEIVGRHWSILTDEATRARVERVLETIVETRRAHRAVGENLTRDGEVRICEWYNAPLFDVAGEITGVASMVQDITERRRTEDALRESEDNFRQLAENIREVFWIASPEGEIHYVSPAYEEITGRTCADLYERGEFVWDAVHPDDLERVAEARRRVARGEPAEVEFRHQHDEGSMRWLRARAFPVRDERGEPYRVVGIVEDVTDRKRAELERAAAEAHYQRLVETSPEAIYVLDPAGLVTEANPALERLLDRPGEQVLGHHFSEFIAPEDLSRAEDVFSELTSGSAERLSLVVQLLRPSGERRRASVSAVAVTQEGVPAGVHGIIHDITVASAQQEQMRLLAAALEGLDEGVFVRTIEGEIVFANAMLHVLLGVEAAEMPGFHMADFVPDGPSVEEAERITAAVLREGRWAGRFPVRRRDPEEVFPVEAILGRIERREGPPLIFGILRDVTEEVVRERYLRRAERLGSLGTLVRGVAHEINNPLHAIRNFADLMLQEERNQDDLEALGFIRQEADRAAGVVADMHHFARQAEDEEGDRSIVDLNEPVREALRHHQYALRSQSIRLEEQLADDLPPVRANPNDVKQVILSLLTNAEHAMEEGDGERTLIVRTRPSALGAAVEVIDSGTGIAPEHLERIFDPFWTTKAPGEGRGLGLSVSHSIVTDHGGEIRVDSKPGQGTTFVVNFPLGSPDYHWEPQD